MKIALDHQIFCNQYYGGISRYFVSITQSMCDMGHEACVFAPFHINRYLAEIPADAVRGRFFNRYPPKTARLFAKLNPHVAKWQITKWRPDVVHETYFSKTPMGPVGVPTVITVYDMIHEIYPELLAKGDRTSELKRIAVERADHVICISDSTRNDLIRLFNVPEQKTTTVYLAADVSPTPRDDAARATAEHPRPYLLYVGMRGGHKNFSGLVDAVAGSPRLRSDFDVVAFGGGDFSDAERSAIDGASLSADRVHHVSGDDAVLNALYANAGAFVYPSLYEGFGLPPLEAMTYNCPVVSSNTSSMPEVIGDAGEYFPPTDIGAMSRAIESVVYSEDRRRDLVAKGRDRLREFSWEKCAAQTLAVYQGLHG
jgi:glycosyltransferase involved in cell wall biosynthesis